VSARLCVRAINCPAINCPRSTIPRLTVWRLYVRTPTNKCPKRDMASSSAVGRWNWASLRKCTRCGIEQTHGHAENAIISDIFTESHPLVRKKSSKRYSVIGRFAIRNDSGSIRASSVVPRRRQRYVLCYFIRCAAKFVK